MGELALPEDRDPTATLVCLHPLPTHGGMMDSHIFRKASFRLPALAGVAVLRFNTRGTWSEQGTSEGSSTTPSGERYDVAAAIEYAEFADLPAIWLLGWSFGTDLALMHGLRPGRRRERSCSSPPLRFSDPRTSRGGRSPASRWRVRPRARRLPPAGRGGRERFARDPPGRDRAVDGLQAPLGG